ncbi:unnamed protein product [Rhizophagus irregularis]|uniref:Uncharacterized protein n=1 Tax=Rhizophagus irregularis TaxID=588596 RepID=A0A916E0V9_9GLOM|nr:unnamed protein product [Rhizophagus irregularis]CAB5346333.1 unnamed protein product [Rhizophagus irregularis]
MIVGEISQSQMEMGFLVFINPKMVTKKGTILYVFSGIIVVKELVQKTLQQIGKKKYMTSIYNINLFNLALNINLQQDFFEPVEQNIQYEFEERNNKNINLRIDDIEKEEYLEIKCEINFING